jgi:dTDP-4-dehydrorhamnose 3,5-epimerase
VKVTGTEIPGVLVFEPEHHADERGFLMETWESQRYAEHGLPEAFAQDNVVGSAPGVLRGLHLQHPEAQGKLIHALGGEIFDVAVDVRVGSPTFGRWVGVTLSHVNRRQLWLPPGFAHGYCVPGANAALLAYKMSAPYRPQNELTVRWDDPALSIRWPAPRWPAKAWVMSAKDAAAPLLASVGRERLPSYAAYP